jgi:hypothetical protein
MLHELQQQYEDISFENKQLTFHHMIHQKQLLDFVQHLLLSYEYYQVNTHNQQVLVHLLNILLKRRNLIFHMIIIILLYSDFEYD